MLYIDERFSFFNCILIMSRPLLPPPFPLLHSLLSLSTFHLPSSTSLLPSSQIIVSTRPVLKFEAFGQVSILQFKTAVKAHIVVEQSPSTAEWGFGIGVEASSFHLSEVR